MNSLEMQSELRFLINPQMIYHRDFSEHQLDEVTVKVLHFIHSFHRFSFVILI